MHSIPSRDGGRVSGVLRLLLRLVGRGERPLFDVSLKSVAGSARVRNDGAPDEVGSERPRTQHMTPTASTPASFIDRALRGRARVERVEDVITRRGAFSNLIRYGPWLWALANPESIMTPCRIDMWVTLPGVDAYSIVRTLDVPTSRAFDVQEGCEVPVIVNPDDHRSVFIHFGELRLMRAYD